MKRQYIYLFTLPLLTLFASCSSTSKMSLSVIKPSRIYLPISVDSIAVVNTTVNQSENEILSTADRIIGLETKDLDKNGAMNYTRGVTETLKRNNRFTHVKSIDSLRFTDRLQTSLSWENIDSICKADKVEAVIEVRNFDTDGNIKYTNKTIDKKGPLGVIIPVIEHTATLNTKINTETRLYLKDGMQLRDEDKDAISFNVVGKGINPVTAAKKLTDRTEAVNRYAFELGETYAVKYLNTWVRVSRDYYVRGTSNFEIAQRRAQAGDWDGAAELWLIESNNSDPKMAGRGCYNMGISSEINGDLENAITWVSRAYTDYNDKIALNYLNILKRRQREQARL